MILPEPWWPRRLGSWLRRGPTRWVGATFSCVVDRQRRFQDQAALWTLCLLRHQGVPPARAWVHLVQPADPAFVAWLSTLGVRTVPVEPFDPRSPHCNKLRQLETDFGEDVGPVVLMDCDTVWLGEHPLPAAEPFAAKLVDRPNPAPEILGQIFAASGLGEPRWVQVSVSHPGLDEKTDRNNCNGGVYLLRRGEPLAALAEAWPRWARWCLDHRELFGPSIHFDQVSYALAMRELGEDTDLLGLEWNYPTHVPAWPLPDLAVQVVHYHRRYDKDLRLLPVGVGLADAALVGFNDRMADELSSYREACAGS